MLSVIVGLALAMGAALLAFTRWRRRTRRRLLRDSSLVPTARGPIDCMFAGPEGAPPVLVLHGGLGGWDQAIMVAEDFDLGSRYRVIAPSRPGYLRTPLTAGAATDDAADAMIALLDALEIAAVNVVGVSGGGPTALSLAARYPHRVAALVMVCAISHRHVQPAITTQSFLGRMLFSNAGAWVMDLGCWLFMQTMRIAPVMTTGRVLKMTELGSAGEIRTRLRSLRGDPQRLHWPLRLLEHSFPISPRRIGLNNDLAQFASLKQGIDAKLACPVLVVHGRIDGNVPVEHAQAVIDPAASAESLIIDDASHLDVAASAKRCDSRPRTAVPRAALARSSPHSGVSAAR